MYKRQADERLPLRQLRVAFAHVAQEDDVLLPIRAEHLGKGRVGIDLQQRADQTGRQHVALTGVALPALHDLAALDERHLRQAADIEREEVDRRGVQAVVLHPLPDGKAGAGGFAVFGLEGDVGIVMRRVVRELRVDLLLGDCLLYTSDPALAQPLDDGVGRRPLPAQLLLTKLRQLRCGDRLVLP